MPSAPGPADASGRSASPATSVQLLRRVALFQALTDEHLQGIAAATQHVRLSRGAMLFQKGDRANGFYVVISGQVKLAFPSVHGVEKVVEILGPGQSFGEALMFMDRPYPVFSQAVVDTSLLAVPRTAVIELLDRDPVFARAMLAGLSMRLHSLVQDVEDYTMHSSVQRLIGYLLRHAETVESGTVEILLPTAKGVIASRLNLTPETLSRILHELAGEGLLEVQGRRIVIHDVARLRSFQG